MSFLKDLAIGIKTRAPEIDHVEEEMDKLGIAPNRREGVREGRWAVLDYGDVIVHIFNDETRLFYHLEKQ